jgi:hypothetical protein
VLAAILLPLGKATSEYRALGASLACRASPASATLTFGSAPR